MQRPRVLISAFACNPTRGSEPGLGYRYVRALADHCDLTVITEALQNRGDIEDQQRRDPVLADVRFHYVPWPSLTRDGQRNDGVNFIYYYHLYRKWQREAFEVASRLVRTEEFDLVHHLTMTGYREPGYLGTLPLPFVWGPVGGHVMMPWRFLHTLGLRGMMSCATRNALNWVQMRWSPRVRAAARSAAAVLASTSVDVRAMRQCHGREAVLVGENGADAPRAEHPRSRRDGQILRLGWSGLHIPRKALPILLRAMALLPRDMVVEAHILGDGPERRRWQDTARRLGVDRLCHFHGWRPRAEAMELMSSMDAFVVTSIQDAGSAVLFEAMAVGLPIICHNCCGFADALTKDCAIMVPLKSPRLSESGFAGGIERLFLDGDLYRRLSAGAIVRAKELSWGQRAHAVLRTYNSVIESSIAAPRTPLREPITLQPGAAPGTGH